MNRYNPEIHHRKSMRLKGYDYSQQGFYYITICCQNRICYFGNIENDEMILNDFGKIAFDEWFKLPNRFSHCELHCLQIMPNHTHGIIELNEPNNDDLPKLSQIIGMYKSLVFQQCLKISKLNNEYLGRLWQRNYYDHIIRDDEAYQNITEYIITNPKNWENDEHR